MCLDTVSVAIYIHVCHPFSGKTQTRRLEDASVDSEKMNGAGARGCQGSVAHARVWGSCPETASLKSR